MITTAILPSLVTALAAPQPAPIPLTFEPRRAYPSRALYAPVQDDSEGYDFSYTFAELGLTSTDIDGLAEDADTYYLAASLGLGIFQIVASYENTDLDIGDSSSDTLRLGAGAHFSLTPRVDLQGDISWLYSDASSNFANLNDSSNGYEVRGGLRWMALPWNGGGLELAGNILYRDLETAFASEEDQFGWEAQARVHLLKLLSVGGSYIQRADDEQYLFNARVSF